MIGGRCSGVDDAGPSRRRPLPVFTASRRGAATDPNRITTMITQHNRPVFLDLRKIRLPVAAVLSIGHRISGIFLTLSVPLMIYLLDTSVSAGPEGFARAGELVAGWPFAILLFLILWALAHHFLAGIRYLLLDLAVGVERPLFRQTALAVLAAAPVIALVLTGALR
jgi:succinate dehydrogenase / fumarate reductase cytochrome b subunit